MEKNPNQVAGNNENNANVPTASVYNLIILDESGSMSGVTRQTITGCNETLNCIRTSAQEDKSMRQFVSIYCFYTEKSRYLMKNAPIEDINDITARDYSPNGCTPLYDAIGNTVSELKTIAHDSETTAKVTIITDGMENASRKWTHSAVVEIIESLKKQGWVFTFIGANIDVERTSRGLGITSFMEFDQTDEGMHNMFAREISSRRAHSKKMEFMRKSNFYRDACETDKMEILSACNENYFTESVREAPGRIYNLEPNEIFVFGSNIAGNHNGSAAALAVQRFGAVMGQAEGLQGQSYAIPSVGTSIAELTEAINRFTEFVVRNPKYKFMVTAIGCGNAGYTPAQIAPLFKQAYEFGNVYLPASFLPYVTD